MIIFGPRVLKGEVLRPARRPASPPESEFHPSSVEESDNWVDGFSSEERKRIDGGEVSCYHDPCSNVFLDGKTILYKHQSLTN